MSRSRLIAALVAVLCLPAAAVGWLGFRLIRQDGALEKQRVAESREMAADKAVQTLSAMLSEPRLFSSGPASGAMLVRLPESPLLYRDRVPARPEASAGAFREGEALEYQRGETAAAAEIYRRQAQSRDPQLRAGALYRLGRTLAKAGRNDEALQAYAALARMAGVSVDGWPAPVAAVWSRCRVFEAAGRKEELRHEALNLGELLLAGRYPMTRAAYSAFADDAARWSGRPRPVDLERLTDAALMIEGGVRDGTRAASGRAVLPVQDSRITVIWGPSGGVLAVFAAGEAFVEREWLSKVGPGVWLRDEGGRVLGAPSRGQTAVRYAVESHLPWTVLAVAPEPGQDLSARRNSLLVLLAAVGIFTLTGAYIVVRALKREFALARMQEDFVAAVSHEFRTPLTTLRQLTESLEDGRIAGGERLLSCYRSLSRATQRLHRLVEDLLDFRRMQSGAFEYRRARVNVREFTGQLVSDFQREVEDVGFSVESAPGPDVEVLADQEALTRALWNLLDNAVKYSGKARTVELNTQCRDRLVEWSVRDHGAGIPEQERALVFQKFYRGESARRAGIRGTGIGLAMVQQIVLAHGGSVSLASEEGEGSVFTIAIPCEASSCSES